MAADELTLSGVVAPVFRHSYDGRVNESSDLPDLGGVTLADLRALPDSEIAPILQRIVRQLKSGTEPVAGFQSAVDQPS